MNSLKSSNKIPIKNIFYMLCYAWNRLEEKDDVFVSRADEKDIYHFLSKILVNRIRILIRRGYYKEYKYIQENTPTIRGKINFQQSSNELTFKKARMYCQFDEMTHNILHNQVIKSTLYELLKNNQLDKKLKEEMQQIYRYFGGIEVIKINSQVFNQVQIHRSNSHYGFLIDICRFLYESLLMNEVKNGETFIDFEQNDKAMAYLYEDFVRNFYKEELQNSRVYREDITWKAEGEKLSYLPLMKTDISIDINDEKIIMDTKYYQNATSTRFENDKLISNNLYQLFAYLNNDKRNENKDITGILLYPKVDKELDLFYTILGYKVKVCMVDLNQEWRMIHKRLLEVVAG